MTSTAQSLLDSPFASLPALIQAHAQAAPERLAVVQGEQSWTYQALNRRVDHIAAALLAAGLRRGGGVALCGATSMDALAVFLGALRAGGAAVPLAASASAPSLAGMLADSGASWFFADDDVPPLDALMPAGGVPVQRVSLGRGASRPAGLDAGRGADRGADHAAGLAAHEAKRAHTALAPLPLDTWLAAQGAAPGVDVAPWGTPPPAIAPQDTFNLIYSSGTTGQPKGVVQAHAMRWAHIQRARRLGYGPDSRTLVSTPLYSNTTLVSLVPALAYGGAVVLMAKFDARAFLQLAQATGMTHAMLVPVQYRRLMAVPDFDSFDLRSTVTKLCTSAPFEAALKADILRRWPGGLVEIYGMTEGGGTCMLEAHVHPDKLHTVGCAAPGHDLRVIDENGLELPRGATGEVVGHSPGMMSGYHRLPELSAQAEWFDAQGKRFIRTGDIGRFDEQGFLVLLDRKKDLIISGGFNVYPSDLEAVLMAHPAVAEAAVLGVPSETWGETPLACAVLKPGAVLTPPELLDWAHARLGKTQRISQLVLLAELPRSSIGKVLKRELLRRFTAGVL